MKKIRLLLAVVTGFLVSQGANAALVISTTQTADNQEWPSLPSGYYPYGHSSGPNGYYDAFSIQVNGTPGEAINNLTFGFSFNGYFDDSVAFDLNGDGTIDWAGDYFDIAAAMPGYAPWNSLADAQNTKVILNIGTSGSTVTLKVYGQTITQGTGTDGDADNLNNVSGFTLSSLGLPGVIPGGGSASMTNPLRVGFVNTSGIGSGTPTINTSDFFTGDGGSAAVPEPGQVAASLLLLSGIGGYVFVKRRKAAKPAAPAAA
jgi:hypothetical protein